MLHIKEGLELIELGEEDGTVIFDGSTGDSVILDPVGADIMRCISKTNEIEDVISELTEIYTGDPEIIRRDILSFVKECMEHGILCESDQPT